MPLQNRVTPTGEIVADPARGLLMGNRGCLHRPDRQLGASRWRSAAWICCVLDWRGRRRDPMPPGRWTALFFLDEATALAAGHRPCAYCRRADYLRFAGAWQAAQRLPSLPRAPDMDQILHRERLDPARRQRTHRAPAAGLPDGVMIRAGGRSGCSAAASSGRGRCTATPPRRAGRAAGAGRGAHPAGHGGRPARPATSRCCIRPPGALPGWARDRTTAPRDRGLPGPGRAGRVLVGAARPPGDLAAGRLRGRLGERHHLGGRVPAGAGLPAAALARTRPGRRSCTSTSWWTTWPRPARRCWPWARGGSVAKPGRRCMPTRPGTRSA